jgi:hypothetical protein
MMTLLNKHVRERHTSLHTTKTTSRCSSSTRIDADEEVSYDKSTYSKSTPPQLRQNITFVKVVAE